MDNLQDLVEAGAPMATAAVTRSRVFSDFMIFGLVGFSLVGFRGEILGFQPSG